MEMDHDARRYVERWFWTLVELAEAIGAAPHRVERLIAAGCAPGPIYVRTSDDAWWSALDDRPMPAGEAWYAPGAAWGLRRAVLACRGGARPDEAAAMLRDGFATGFVEELERFPDAVAAFPDCFVAGEVEREAARVTALGEWAAWLGGGYGVCLRVFTPASCIFKETLGAAMKAGLAAGDRDPVTLLAQAEMLAGLILPFAPWQRATGTPGRTIDRLLAEQDLGRERPYD